MFGCACSPAKFPLVLIHIPHRGHFGMPNDDIVTVKVLADYLKIAENTTYRFASEGKVPGFKVVSAWRFCKSEIDRWIVVQEQSQEGEQK